MKRQTKWTVSTLYILYRIINVNLIKLNTQLLNTQSLNIFYLSHEHNDLCKILIIWFLNLNSSYQTTECIFTTDSNRWNFSCSCYEWKNAIFFCQTRKFDNVLFKFVYWAFVTVGRSIHSSFLIIAKFFPRQRILETMLVLK